MKRLMLFGAILTVLAAVTAAGGQHKMGQLGKMTTNCPMHVPGADVAVADTPAGIAVTFTTKADDEAAAELRARVERLAKMHGALTDRPGMMAGPLIPGEVAYEGISDGARLTLRPKDPARLEEFRAQVREHVEHMRKGNFRMMEMMMRMMEERLEGDPVPPAETEIPCFE